MKNKTYVWIILVWLLFAAIGILNGIIRNATYQKIVGDLAAHQISTAILIITMFTIMYLFFNKTQENYTGSMVDWFRLVYCNITL